MRHAKPVRLKTAPTVLQFGRCGFQSRQVGIPRIGTSRFSYGDYPVRLKTAPTGPDKSGLSRCIGDRNRGAKGSICFWYSSSKKTARLSNNRNLPGPTDRLIFPLRFQDVDINPASDRFTRLIFTLPNEDFTERS